MSSTARLRTRLIEQQPKPQLVTGRWRTISLCLDEDAGEFFNVGVLFVHDEQVEVRMLDNFDRLKCLFDGRIDIDELFRTLHEIEVAILLHGPELPDELGSTIRLGVPLYASGFSAREVLDEFFADVVTLGKPRRGTREVAFRYQSTLKLRNSIFNFMQKRMQVQASRIIRPARYELRLGSGHRFEIDIPLMSDTASGSIVSGWYKNPLVVKNSLLQASADLNLMRSNTPRDQAVISILVPDRESGLTAKEYGKLVDTTREQLERIRATGIEIIEASSTLELAELTSAWWSNCCT
ncbi:hypothetical protein [Azotobacter salinestris]|uniref:hypothetical protein n=1 Tax=Azotobacter salinestris TaxID=69964 RepID=UPI0032E04B5B